MIGQILSGRYRLERVLGENANGVLYAAHDREEECEVAVKLVRPKETLRPNVVTAVLEAMRATKSLKSEHTARVLQVETTDLGVPFLVLEALPGKSLETFMRDRGALPMSQALEIVLQACASVAEAHRLGFAHGSLSASSLFVTTERLVKVIDFAVAIPEDNDAREDVRALAVVLHEALTGHPFTKATPIGSYGVEAPPTLEAIVMRCLEDDVRERYADAGELEAALHAFVARKEEREEPPSTSRSARVAPLPVARAIGLASGGASSAFSTQRERPMWLAMLGLVIVVLGASAYATLRPRQPRASFPATASAAVSTSTPAIPNVPYEPPPGAPDPLLDCPRPPTEVKARFYVAIEIRNLGFHPNEGLETRMEHAAVCELALHPAFRVVPHDGSDATKIREFAAANELVPWRWSIAFLRGSVPDSFELRVTATRNEVLQASLVPVRYVEIRPGKPELNPLVEAEARSIVKDLVMAVDRPLLDVPSDAGARTCAVYGGDYALAMRGKDYLCVRTILTPRLDAKEISSGEARYLKAACSALGDEECQKRAVEKISDASTTSGKKKALQDQLKKAQDEGKLHYVGPAAPPGPK